MKNLPVIAVAALCATAASAHGDECKIAQMDTFQPQHEHVALARSKNLDAGANFILYQAKLRVNTDGAPTSYHPEDPRGNTKAINNVVNGISISKRGASLSYGEKIKAFEAFRDGNWAMPDGYRIKWQNVIAPTTVAGKTVPCVFSTGDFKGYFGSLTTLKNGLSSADAGECQVNDQLDQRFIPGLVLPGGVTPVISLGGGIGDIAIAINPETGKTVAAVVADGGPPDNLGEGSVALNMALLGKTILPVTYAEAKKLDTNQVQMIVAIIPASRDYELERPYSAENLKSRLTKWGESHGYTSLNGLAQSVRTCAGKL